MSDNTATQVKQTNGLRRPKQCDDPLLAPFAASTWQPTRPGRQGCNQIGGTAAEQIARAKRPKPRAAADPVTYRQFRQFKQLISDQVAEAIAAYLGGSGGR